MPGSRALKQILAAGMVWLGSHAASWGQEGAVEPGLPPISQPLPMPASPPVNNLAVPVQPSYTLPGTAGMGYPLLESQPMYQRQPLPTGEATPVYARPVDVKPLPGSLEYSYEMELAAREQQRQLIWNGTTIQNFPSTLLWEVPFASKREPRMMVQGTSYENYVNTRTLETSIGTTLGLFRITPPGHDWAFQIDFFGVVHSRLSPEDLMASDYRFGVPLTFHWADFHGKISFEHTSAHLGDEYQRNTRVLPYNFSKDEAVLGVGHYFLERSLRVYGQVSYAFFQDVVNDPNRYRYDLGFQYIAPGGGSVGSPFIAAHVDYQGLQKFQANYNAQAGWIWRNPTQRLSNVRVFAEYYKGRSPYGQFLFNREDFYGVGLSCDF